MIYSFIKNNEQLFPIEKMCKVLKVRCGSYYRWKKQTITARQQEGFLIAYLIDSENYFNSKSDYENALIAAYDLLQTTYLNALLGEIASDNTLVEGESQSDTSGFQQIDDMIYTPLNSNLENLWDLMFAGIQRANYILEFKDKTDFEGKNQVIGEARFLRAHYHFELVK